MRLFILALFAAFSSSIYSQDAVYVWNFSDRNGKENDLTQIFTEDFEEALLKTDCCEVLQRRVYSRIFQQKENEKAILSLNQLSPSTIEDFEAVKANTIVFGQVQEDSGSGQIKVTISFEKFSGIIDRTASIYMAKYDVNNPKKRIEAINELIDELKLKPENPSIETEQIDEWEFSLIGCERIGKNVKCSYYIKSNYRDRNILMYQAEAFDEYGYKYRARNQQLGNMSGGSFKYQLIDGIQVLGYTTFENVSSRANKFPLLILNARGDDLTTNKIEFRDITIK